MSNQEDSPTAAGTTDETAKARPTEVAVKDDSTGGGLQVIGAGFGRTGTSSLQEALVILGFGPCYHMRELFKDPDGPQKWDTVGINQQMLEQHHPQSSPTKQEWDAILGGYRSTLDFPTCMYYQDLLQHYPDAKVILTVRDTEGWYKSFSETIMPAHPLWNFIYDITGLNNPLFQRMMGNNVWKPVCGGRSQARKKEIITKAFEDHNAKCQATVPSDKLLVFSVKEGWEPLCAFLNCPVPAPDVPFPRSWDAASFQAMVATKRKKAVKRLLLGTAVIVGTAVVVALGIVKSKSGSNNTNTNEKREIALLGHIASPWQ